MNVQVTNVTVHEPAQVHAILLEARALAFELSDERLTYETAFNAAVQLLGQRYTFAAQQQPMALPDLVPAKWQQAR